MQGWRVHTPTSLSLYICITLATRENMKDNDGGRGDQLSASRLACCRSSRKASVRLSGPGLP